MPVATVRRQLRLQRGSESPPVPFGGSKASGYGPHEQGPAAIEFYTEEITIYRDV